MVMQMPEMPFSVWLVMVALSLGALWACWDEFRGLAMQSPTAVRLTTALILAVIGASVLYAQPVGLMCDWNDLLELCGGSEACAYIAYWMNGCPFLGN